MPAYIVVGQHIISEHEFEARGPEITPYLKALSGATAPPPGKLMLSGGRALSVQAPMLFKTLAPPVAVAAATGAQPTGPQPIGPKLPLSAYIIHVYTGKYPEHDFFGNRGDMAITSGVKSFSASQASARALNFLEAQVYPSTHFIAPAATNQGTPLILYSPAMTDSAVTLTVQMATANDFVKDLLDEIGTGFTALAGIPILLPYSGYLLAGSALLKVGEGIADALYDSVPVLLQSTQINFDVAFTTPAQAGLRFFCNQDLDPQQYQYVDGKGLADSSGNIYNGPEPYIVVALDGTPHDGWKGFTPAVATAAVIQKFFSAQNVGQTTIDTLVDAVKIASDFKYRQQAEQLKTQINAVPAPADKADLQADYDAAVKNIVNPDMVPK
jgi:hypothetical protein